MHKEIGTNKYPVFYMYIQMEKKIVRIRKPPQLWVSVDSRIRIKKRIQSWSAHCLHKMSVPNKVLYW